jgi:general secretion pathway protein I
MMRVCAGQRGFTLLELLVAFTIVAISLGMLYRASGAGARSVGDIERYQRAVVLAESLLAVRDSVPPQGWNQAGESAGYSWRVSSAPYPSAVENPNVPALHEITIAVAWRDAERPRQLEFSTLLPERKPVDPGRSP